ncbi:hypothetical protein [Chryseobacterium gossypii]|uniref:hypothetical protein n=1 Tax=Chryseobacterium gossypii TaxID=3231602 RepID=UPI003524519C
MKKVFINLIILTLISCNFSEKKIYKDLYVTNGGEFHDYPVAAIKLDDSNQLNITLFEVKDYKISNKYIIFKCVDYYGDDKYYFIDKTFDKYNYEEKIKGPLNKSEFEILNNKEKLNIKWK